MLSKTTIVVGPFQCNCSILICDQTQEAIVIDAGDEFSRIQAELEKQKVVVKYSVHTHAHLDHIGAVSALKQWQPSMKILLHKDDEWLYTNLPMQGQLFGFQYGVPPLIDSFLQDNEVLNFGKYQFSVLHTPGHSPGSVCLSFKEGVLGVEPVLFSGDTLFEKSIGRTDLWGGDYHQLVRNIRERLLILDSQTLVLPGHGSTTTIGVEHKQNPFL